MDQKMDKKTDIYHFRINPEVRKKVEEIYRQSGLTFTQAINAFVQQSINVGGLPFEANIKTAEIIKKNALKQLVKELELGMNSEMIDEEDALKELEMI